MALGGHAVCWAAGYNSTSSGCKQQTFISHIVERDVRDTGVGQRVPPEASPGRADAILSPCPHVGIPLCVSVSQSPQKDTSHMGSHLSSVYLHHPPKGPAPSAATVSGPGLHHVHLGHKSAPNSSGLFRADPTAATRVMYKIGNLFKQKLKCKLEDRQTSDTQAV